MNIKALSLIQIYWISNDTCLNCQKLCNHIVNEGNVILFVHLLLVEIHVSHDSKLVIRLKRILGLNVSKNTTIKETRKLGEIPDIDCLVPPISFI